MARHNVERATDETQHLLESARRILSYDTPQIIFWNATKGEQPDARNAPCPPRTPGRNQQRMLATDTPTTLLAVAMTHYELPGLGLDQAECRPGTDRCSLPLLPYLRTGTAPGDAGGLEGLCRELGSLGTACRSYLDPGLRPGFFGSRFGLSLEKGAA